MSPACERRIENQEWQAVEPVIRVLAKISQREASQRAKESSFVSQMELLSGLLESKDSDPWLAIFYLSLYRPSKISRQVGLVRESGKEIPDENTGQRQTQLQLDWSEPQEQGKPFFLDVFPASVFLKAPGWQVKATAVAGLRLIYQPFWLKAQSVPVVFLYNHDFREAVRIGEPRLEPELSVPKFQPLISLIKEIAGDPRGERPNSWVRR